MSAALLGAEALGVAGADISRRARRKRELRGRILEAAAELFEAKGFEATRVAEICERADVAHKTFFNHFPSKRLLLRELAGALMERFLAELEEARAQGCNTRERLLLLFTRSAERARAMHRELVIELVHAVHESEQRTEQARRLQEGFGKIVRDGLRAGEVTRRHEARTITEMILGAYYVLVFNYANLDGFPMLRQAEAAARFLADSIAHKPDEGGT